MADDKKPIPSQEQVPGLPPKKLVRRSSETQMLTPLELINPDLLLGEDLAPASELAPLVVPDAFLPPEESESLLLPLEPSAFSKPSTPIPVRTTPPPRSISYFTPAPLSAPINPPDQAPEPEPLKRTFENLTPYSDDSHVSAYKENTPSLLKQTVAFEALDFPLQPPLTVPPRSVPPLVARSQRSTKAPIPEYDRQKDPFALPSGDDYPESAPTNTTPAPVEADLNAQEPPSPVAASEQPEESIEPETSLRATMVIDFPPQFEELPESPKNIKEFPQAPIEPTKRLTSPSAVPAVAHTMDASFSDFPASLSGTFEETPVVGTPSPSAPLESPFEELTPPSFRDTSPIPNPSEASPPSLISILQQAFVHHPILFSSICLILLGLALYGGIQIVSFLWR